MLPPTIPHLPEFAAELGSMLPITCSMVTPTTHHVAVVAPAICHMYQSGCFYHSRRTWRLFTQSWTLESSQVTRSPLGIYPAEPLHMITAQHSTADYTGDSITYTSLGL